MRHINVRFMIRRDMPEVLEIDRHSFAEPWGRDGFSSRLRQKYVIGMVAERGNRIVGYVVYELHARSIDILALAVHVGHRREGVGMALVEKLASKLERRDRRRIESVIPDSNLDAHLFLRDCGFRCEAILRGWCDDKSDAYAFAYEMPAPVALAR